jgi:hypothetical protein
VCVEWWVVWGPATGIGRMDRWHGWRGETPHARTHARTQTHSHESEHDLALHAAPAEHPVKGVEGRAADLAQAPVRAEQQVGPVAAARQVAPLHRAVAAVAGDAAAAAELWRGRGRAWWPPMSDPRLRFDRVHDDTFSSASATHLQAPAP